jgi:flagellar motor component MotA
MAGGHLASIMQKTAALLLIGGTTGAMLMSFSLETHGKAFKAVLSKKSSEETTLRLARDYFSHLEQITMVIGIVGFVIGLINVFQHMENTYTLGPGIAVSSVSLLYGYLMRLFFAGPLHELATEKLKHQYPEG